MLMVVATRGDFFRLMGWIYQGVGRGNGMLVSQRCKHLRLKHGEDDDFGGPLGEILLGC